MLTEMRWKRNAVSLSSPDTDEMRRPSAFRNSMAELCSEHRGSQQLSAGRCGSVELEGQCIWPISSRQLALRPDQTLLRKITKPKKPLNHAKSKTVLSSWRQSGSGGLDRNSLWWVGFVEKVSFESGVKKSRSNFARGTGHHISRYERKTKGNRINRERARWSQRVLDVAVLLARASVKPGFHSNAIACVACVA